MNSRRTAWCSKPITMVPILATAGFRMPAQQCRCLLNPSKIMYSSDWPFTPEPAVLALARKLEESKLMSSSMINAVMRDNALALFPRFK
jgi:predicted TIM-barrel fold metal-dependent hydrolase